MAKYKKQIDEMLQIHKDLFDPFRDIHNKYDLNPEKLQKEFNEMGQEVLGIIRRYENNLCSKSESGKYGRFSANLSDKFWTEIRLIFPK